MVSSYVSLENPWGCLDEEHGDPMYRYSNFIDRFHSSLGIQMMALAAAGVGTLAN